MKLEKKAAKKCVDEKIAQIIWAGIYIRSKRDSFSYQKSMLLTLFLDSVTINHNFLLIVLLKLSFGLKTKTLI